MSEYGKLRRDLLIGVEDELRTLMLDLAALLTSRLERYTDAEGRFPVARQAEMVNELTSQLVSFFSGPTYDPYGSASRPVQARSTYARFLHQSVIHLVTLAVNDQRRIITHNLPEETRLRMAVGVRARPDMPLPYWQRRDASGLTTSDYILRAFEELRRRLVAFLLADNRPFDGDELSAYLDPVLKTQVRGVSGTNGGYIPARLTRSTLSSTESAAVAFMALYNPAIGMLNWRRSSHRVTCTTSICDINEAGSPYPIERVPAHPAHGSCLCYFEEVLADDPRPIEDLELYLSPLSPLFVQTLTGDIDRIES